MKDCRTWFDRACLKPLSVAWCRRTNEGANAMAVPNRLNRRRILRGASVLGAAGALAALPSADVGYAEPAHPAARGPAGSWVAMVTIAGGPPPFQVLRTF